MNIKKLLLPLMAAMTLFVGNLTAVPQTYNDLPNFRLVLSDTFSDCIGIGLLGEAGDKVYRGNGTVGFFLTSNHRFKVGGEYLAQKLKYKFDIAGQERVWEHQWAVGGKYEFLVDQGCFCSGFVRSFDFGGWYAHSRDHEFDTVTTTSLVNRTEYAHRIAGANAYDLSLGATVTPWSCATFYGAVTYDNVNYRNKILKHKRVDGVGCEFAWTQGLMKNVDFTARAEVKHPYNFYSGLINWRDPFCIRDLGVGLFIDYTRGKEDLPIVTAFGVQLSYDFGFCGRCSQDSSCCQPTNCCYANDLKSWVESPAVYVPIVLAIAEEEFIVTDTCCLPTSTTITGFPADITGTVTFDVRPFFSANCGGPLTFTVVILDPNVTATISNGILTVTPINTEPGATLVVTGSNACGSTSQTLDVTIGGGG